MKQTKCLTSGNEILRTNTRKAAKLGNQTKDLGNKSGKKNQIKIPIIKHNYNNSSNQKNRVTIS